MEDRVFQELPDDFWDTPRARASYKVKLDDSDSDFESALLEQILWVMGILRKIIHQTLRKGESV